ncbi:N-acylamino acid racemase [Natrinema altunense JCM 12890]|uniref:N-acylamino acid racemase n=1 Tax=Natrinema altunense (strain JCM 12890 / CGMCC 1.3731 / AJ2) TaxID=1227494 RepID=M0A0C1_NATA2|nr:mandelate racemase/muconate lactonizing enzyme family protein [Natrinema altunense]ELY92024.1 N-acylamino acid racemase [Natrinema altunense JCM 12890]
MITITEIEAIPVRLDIRSLSEPLGIAPYVTTYTEFYNMERVLIRLDTDGDITGWGEMRSTLSTHSTKAVIETDVADKLVGEPVSAVESLPERFDSFQYFDIDPFLGGVEMAMWDAWGQYLGQPLYRLLGGKVREEIDVSFCLGVLEPEESREHAREALEHGFDVLKTKAGRDWRTDVERIVAMHDEVNGQLEFRLDPNEGWTTEEAVRVAASLEDEGIYLQYLEQPMRIDNFGSFKRLRERLRTPIAANEDMYFRHNLLELIKQDAIDAGVIDMVPAGGLQAAKRLAGIAGDAGLSLSHHCAFDLGIKSAALAHLVATTPAINLPPDSVYYAWDDHVIEEPFDLSDGSLPVPEKPGLGVTVDVSDVEEHRTDR